MKHFEYWSNADGQGILSDRSVWKAEKSFRENEAQPLLDILIETIGKPLPASLSTLLSDILMGKVTRRKGVSKQFTLTDYDICMIGCMVRDLRDSGVKRNFALQDVAEFFNQDPEFERRIAELDSLGDSAGLPTMSLTRVKLAYKAFQAVERKRNKSLSKTSSSIQ